MYANKLTLAKIFGISPPTVYRRIEGIKAEIGTRYNRYAILDNVVSVAVFADYDKYHRQLEDKIFGSTFQSSVQRKQVSICSRRI